MLADIGHPFARGEKVYDVTFENVQAGLRTDYLFRLANQHRGLVVGTGDLSELGLGWCTYGVGDHMSHYNVNGSVSKTLIQHLIRFVAASRRRRRRDDRRHAARHPRHRNLARAGARPTAARRSSRRRSVVGPYALQDFNLFYLTRSASGRRRSPSWRGMPGSDAEQGRVAAEHAGGRAARLFDSEEIRHWLELFLHALLRQPVQALGVAQRPEDLVRRLAVAARRLARAIGRQCRCLARGTDEQSPERRERRRRVSGGR